MSYSKLYTGIVTGVDANCREFRFYSAGVLDSTASCGNTDANHYLFVIGYEVNDADNT